MGAPIGAGVMAAGDPVAPAGGGLLGHGKFWAPAWSADATTNAETRGRQLALMVRDSPSSNETPTKMPTIRYRTG
jgi:hypothetical protein